MPAPYTWSTSPASAGPNARADTNCIEFSRTAASRSPCATSCGTNACHAAMFSPDAMPEKNSSPTMISGVAAPLSQTAHRPNAITIIPDCVKNSSRLRGKRSASDPASGPTHIAGKNAMNAPTPSHVVDCVSW